MSAGAPAGALVGGHMADVCDTNHARVAKIRKERPPERETHRGCTPGFGRQWRRYEAARAPRPRVHSPHLRKGLRMERARPFPSRRRLLQGAALAALPTALLPDALA